MFNYIFESLNDYEAVEVNDNELVVKLPYAYTENGQRYKIKYFADGVELVQSSNMIYLINKSNILSAKCQSNDIDHLVVDDFLNENKVKLIPAELDQLKTKLEAILECYDISTDTLGLFYETVYKDTYDKDYEFKLNIIGKSILTNHDYIVSNISSYNHKPVLFVLFSKFAIQYIDKNHEKLYGKNSVTYIKTVLNDIFKDNFSKEIKQIVVTVGSLNQGINFLDTAEQIIDAYYQAS